MRGAAWVTLWDNLLEGAGHAAGVCRRGRCAPCRARPTSRTCSASSATSSACSGASCHHPSAPRAAPALESDAARGPGARRTQSQKAAWFNAYRDDALTREGVAWLERVWRREERIPGLTLAEPDEITLALELAVREVPGWEEILRPQLERTQNPDRKARFAFVDAGALSRSGGARTGVRALPLRGEPSPRTVGAGVAAVPESPAARGACQRFVRPALDLLREIQQTGDIFFPDAMDGVDVGGHRSPEAAATVRAVPGEPSRLPAAIAMDDSDGRRRTVSRRPAVVSRFP